MRRVGLIDLVRSTCGWHGLVARLARRRSVLDGSLLCLKRLPATLASLRAIRTRLLFALWSPRYRDGMDRASAPHVGYEYLSAKADEIVSAYRFANDATELALPSTCCTICRIPLSLSRLEDSGKSCGACCTGCGASGATLEVNADLYASDGPRAVRSCEVGGCGVADVSSRHRTRLGCLFLDAVDVDKEDVTDVLVQVRISGSDGPMFPLWWNRILDAQW